MWSFVSKNVGKYLVTGGLGQIGSVLIERLLETTDAKILILDDKSAPKTSFENNRVTLIEDKIEDIEKVNSIFKNNDIDYVVHSAAQISVPKSVENPLFDANTNIIGTLNLLDNAQKCGISNLVTIGSAAVIGEPEKLPVEPNANHNPTSPYGISKSTSEKYTIQYSKLFDLNYNVVRPFNIYSSRMGENNAYSGVLSKFLEFAENNQTFKIEGDGKQTRDFIHVNDVVDIILHALHNKLGGKILNAATGKPTTILELSKIIARVVGVDWKVKHVEERKGDIKHSYGVPPDFKTDFITLENGIRMIYENMKTK